MLSSYKELNVWKKAYALCLSIYHATKSFPKAEVYGLVSQVRRAACVPSIGESDWASLRARSFGSLDPLNPGPPES